MVYKIAITGPESSGKSTLFDFLTSELETVGVKEYAREYLEKNGSNYTFEDFLNIAKKQISNRKQEEFKAKKYLICDTDTLVLKIWAEEKFHKSIDFLEEALSSYPCNLYLLCKPDIPWIDDPQRENPLDRERLFEKYLKYLKKYKLNYQIISGGKVERNRRTLDFIAALELGS